MFRVKELLEATKARLIHGKKDAEVRGISIDSRTIKPQEAFIAIKGANFDGHDFIAEAIKKGAQAIIAQSQNHRFADLAKRISFMRVKDASKALGDIARFHREKFDIPVIAVTGSNGKTTTKEMIAWILSQKFTVLRNAGTKNNQIGLPLTLLNLSASYDLVVLELGTNHFGEIGYLTRICQPNIGIITNIGPAHLEYFKDLKGVFKEKYALIKHLRGPRIVALNSDDEFLSEQITGKNKKTVIFGFGIKYKSDFFATDIRVINSKIEFLVKQKYKFTLNTLGYYNIYNALAAIAVGRLLGMEYRDIAYRLSIFDFPQSRLKLIELNNTKFIDDTYNSNPISLKQALNVLNNLKAKGRKIFVMGDMLELGSSKESFHRQAGQEAAKICDVFITVGKLSKFSADSAKESGFAAKNIFTCLSNLEARDVLFKKISPGPNDIVLIKGSRLMKMEEVFKNR